MRSIGYYSAENGIEELVIPYNIIVRKEKDRIRITSDPNELKDRSLEILGGHINKKSLVARVKIPGKWLKELRKISFPNSTNIHMFNYIEDLEASVRYVETKLRQRDMQSKAQEIFIKISENIGYWRI